MRSIVVRGKPMRRQTIVYVDGFNLYYGALKRSDCKWLDLPSFCRRLLPRNDIVSVKYFTARIAARPNDPDGPTRQHAYLRALATCPEVQIYLGHFLSSAVRLPIVNDDGSVMQSIQLRRVASFLKEVRKGALRGCQFPPVLHDANGPVSRPASW